MIYIEYDTNGKPFRWLWTAKITFIDQKQLTDAVDSVMDKLSKEDLYRNHHGDEVLYVWIG